MPRHILIKLTKTKHKERILKAAREKLQVTYKGNPIRVTADLSAETLQARKEWQDIFKVLKGKNLQPRLQYPASILFTFACLKSFLFLYQFWILAGYSNLGCRFFPFSTLNISCHSLLACRVSAERSTVKCMWFPCMLLFASLLLLLIFFLRV